MCRLGCELTECKSARAASLRIVPPPFGASPLRCGVRAACGVAIGVRNGVVPRPLRRDTPDSDGAGDAHGDGDVNCLVTASRVGTGCKRNACFDFLLSCSCTPSSTASLWRDSSRSISSVSRDTLIPVSRRRVSVSCLETAAAALAPSLVARVFTSFSGPYIPFPVSPQGSSGAGRAAKPLLCLRMSRTCRVRRCEA